MRRDITIKTATFAGASDLTIIAPIRKGFVPSLEAVTYKTRVKRVLAALHLGRQTAHEYDFARVLTDAVERVGRIHSIRIAVLEPEDKVLLAVTFDGSWESYIRVIWQKTARSLDLIFCNTEDYVTGWGNSFEAWCVWLRRSQAESSFLYSPPGLTYQDTHYLRMFERRHRGVGAPGNPDDPASADLALTRARIPSAEMVGDAMCEDGTDPTNMGLNVPLSTPEAGRPAFRQGMRGLAGMYRLVDLHMDAPDRDILHRAASELLREFLPMVTTAAGRAQYQQAITFAEIRFRDALDWLRKTPVSERPIPRLPDVPDDSVYPDVQGGIIASYPDVSDGCLLLLAFDAARHLGDFLAGVRVTSATASLAEGEIAVNVAVSLEGLRLAGWSDDEITSLPQEFVQGMERRAGTLGDLRVNHPRRWRRPALNWAQGIRAADVAQNDPCARVDLASVHLVLQLRIRNTTLSTDAARALLLARYEALTLGRAAPRVLSVQWMQRLVVDKKSNATREHFGFLDSQSEPVLRKADAGQKFPNQVHLGEILLGHDNAADSAAPADKRTPMQQVLRNGSFLVIRKLRQDVGALERALEAAVDDTTPAGADDTVRKPQSQLLLGKMMGRWPIGHPAAGKPLATAWPGRGNDFSFDRDPQGTNCPFHAHIRRANPRDNTLPEPPGARPARLIRRGMSYGPLHVPGQADSLAQERGLVFMAYNASIGEQFEVVQRWLTGGNSSGSYSGQSDPFLGLAEPGRPRYFRFEHGGGTVRMALDGSHRMHDEPQPLVRLEWGMYLLTPSMSALKTLAARASDDTRPFAKSWSVEVGERAIAELRKIEQSQGAAAASDGWKAALEDPGSAARFTTASIWAAIREQHGGVLRTPFGVLVASRTLVDEVLHDRPRNLTATGYLPRMHRSFGPLYLGMDAGQIPGAYELESGPVNQAIMALVSSPAQCNAVINAAAQATIRELQALVQPAIDFARHQCEPRWDITFDAREIIDMVLAHFCEQWFGLSERGGHLKKSGVRWNWQPGEPPCYPGHFMAPSRYTFQPHPGPEVQRVGAENGLALRVAITDYLRAFGKTLTEPVAVAAWTSPAAAQDPTYPARTLAGVLMGFLPTTDGNIRRVLNEWLNDGTLWSLRAQHASAAPGDAAARSALLARLRKQFVAAMQLRAAPELLWRTAVASHSVGAPGPHRVAVRPGEIVIASLISATQECLERGDPSLAYAFGGQRTAGPGHPTHACPGYGPAMAVMLGFFQGLIEFPMALRPGPAPLSFFVEGDVGELPAACMAAVAAPVVGRSGRIGAAQAAPATEATQAGLVAARSRPVPLLTIGDSWLYDYVVGRLELSPSLSTELKDLNFTSDNLFCKTGRTLAEMAQPDRLEKLRSHLANLRGEPDGPRAVLVGGGGNDLVDPPDNPAATRLFGMLVGNAGSAAAALHGPAVAAFIDGELKGFYRQILAVAAAGTDVPILVHAYDHPIPDGRPSTWGPGPWLKPVFDAKQIDEAIRRDIMKALIDRLNAMVAAVATEFPGRVHPVSLNGVLAKEGDFAVDHKTYWANELHATDAGFDILARVVQATLATLGIR